MGTALDQLNEQQRLAATTHEGPLLIIAGAGSGKTRVITERICNMLEKGIKAKSILALTFTNKAAREMVSRVAHIVSSRVRDLSVSTFHSFGVTVLKRYGRRLGYRDNFSIYDAQDQTALLKESARDIKVDLEPGEPARILQDISAVKTGRLALDDLPVAYRDLLDDYSAHLKLYNAVDFDDLVGLPIRLFSEHEDLLGEYRDRYRYIMVDEFQDTSLDQYRLMKLIADGSRNAAVVGDDDQSIYSWRGANYDNFMLFERDYPERTEIKLEQNYRSTDTILTAANSVIANNRNRKGKELWTGDRTGVPMELYLAVDESDEAIFICDTIKTLAMKERLRYGDVAVLVRTNNLVRNIEAAFLRENLAYRVSGGESFFQRKEIKDLIAYMRALANPDDDVSMLRILNRPRRGIGRRTIEQVVATATDGLVSLYSAVAALVHAADAPLTSGAKANLSSFHSLIEEHRPRLLSGREMAQQIKQLVDDIDYWSHLVSEHPDNDRTAKWKYRNIELFIDFLRDYEVDPENRSPSLFEFLSRVSLDPRDDVDDEREPGKVNVMTIHAAKGLEHEVVFVAGCDDGIIPHARSLEENPDNLEEERRLFYVALTRARRRLFVSTCRMRKIMREIRECSPSPFLAEIPAELIEHHTGTEAADDEEGFDYFAALKAKLSGN
jgi:DNA helicase-2/ATP-dependent DNA helicase PcrA